MTDLVLSAARDAVYGDREAEYGHPADDLERTAKMWTAYLDARGWLGPGLTAEDVALMHLDVKRSRLMTTPDHHDSQVDLAGWAECYARVRQRRTSPPSAPYPARHARSWAGDPGAFQ